MRIALITREYPPETSWGGIGTFYFDLAHSLANAGVEVEVFCQGIEKEYAYFDGAIRINRVIPRKWLIGSKVGGDIGGNWNLGIFALSLAVEMYRAVAKRHKEEPFDVIEGHEHLGVCAVVNILLSCRVVTVTRYHTSYHSLVKRKLVDWPKSSLITLLERISINAASCRISISKFIDDIAQEDFKGISRSDVVIPVGASKGEQIDNGMKRNVIIFVGRLVPELKNPDMLAHAFAKLAGKFTDWRVEFAGLDTSLGPGETMWSRCDNILSEYKGRYEYHGQLDRIELHKLYANAKIIVVPSQFESYGLVAQEAMSYGCVPVVADATALPEVVGDAGVVFRKGDSADLLKNLGELMSDVQCWEKLSQKCITLVESRLEESITAMNISAYQQAINNRTASNR